MFCLWMVWFLHFTGSVPGSDWPPDNRLFNTLAIVIWRRMSPAIDMVLSLMSNKLIRDGYTLLPMAPGHAMLGRGYLKSILTTITCGSFKKTEVNWSSRKCGGKNIF